jgi:hypothetical protein
MASSTVPFEEQGDRAARQSIAPKHPLFLRKRDPGFL